ncbi:MAG: hypothetical protein M2R45_04606 [Verrucomicrobia subdivision 3 bacterium]|nr:hypothetical protein [Limisphaerales bacterium]MCS1417331.1 hypothetical protein [Limisphaerales bacterium]
MRLIPGASRYHQGLRRWTFPRGKGQAGSIPLVEAEFDSSQEKGSLGATGRRMAKGRASVSAARPLGAGHDRKPPRRCPSALNDKNPEQLQNLRGGPKSIP